MKREISQRWALSFADLVMLLLGFFVLMQAQRGDRLKMAQGIRTAFGGTGREAESRGFDATSLFEPGEAILKPAARAQFARMGADARAESGQLTVSSQGRDEHSARLDAWELAAARTAAVARAIRSGGLPESRIEIAIPPMRNGDTAGPQRIDIERKPR